MEYHPTIHHPPEPITGTFSIAGLKSSCGTRGCLVSYRGGCNGVDDSVGLPLHQRDVHRDLRAYADHLRLRQPAVSRALHRGELSTMRGTTALAAEPRDSGIITPSLRWRVSSPDLPLTFVGGLF
jgi:hypothetical protein